jgi:hypothetical protein
MPSNIRVTFFHDSTALVRPGLLTVEASRSHSGTPHSIGLLWTSDQPIAEALPEKQITLTRDRRPFPRQNSNLKSQQTCAGRPSPHTARPLGSTHSFHKRIVIIIFLWPAICQFLVMNGVTAVVRYLAVFASLSCCYPPKSGKTLKICPSFKYV